MLDRIPGEFFYTNGFTICEGEQGLVGCGSAEVAKEKSEEVGDGEGS